MDFTKAKDYLFRLFKSYSIEAVLIAASIGIFFVLLLTPYTGKVPHLVVTSVSILISASLIFTVHLDLKGKKSQSQKIRVLLATLLALYFAYVILENLHLPMVLMPAIGIAIASIARGRYGFFLAVAMAIWMFGVIVMAPSIDIAISARALISYCFVLILVFVAERLLEKEERSKISLLESNEKLQAALSTLSIKQEELSRAKDQADAANRAKSLFLANISHEMRTPLNALLGLVKVLKDSNADEAQAGTISKMTVAGESLFGVINDVLDFSKIESGELTLRNEPFFLTDLVSDVHSFADLLAKPKGLEISIDMPTVAETQLLGDRQRIRQMLINLLSNAVKFTPQGEVILRVKTLPHNDAQRIRFEVTDTGVGIPKEVQVRLFRPFSQADSSTFRKFGGTGLGLSIVKSMAEAMGGEVGFSSVPGLGSTFWFELPLVVDDTIDSDNKSKTLQLAIATSDQKLKSLLDAQVRLLGWKAWHVSSCKELDDLIRSKNAKGRLVDCLLIDQTLECGESLNVLKSLRGIVPNESLPATLVVYPEFELPEENANHVDSLLVQPVNPSKLFNEVNKAVLAHRPDDYGYVVKRSNLSQAGLSWLTGIRILLVDDADLNLEVAAYILTQQGATVTSAISGQEAIESLSADPQGFDCVLMDVQMPLMDGYEATQRIKEIPALAQLPIIALTAGAMQSEMQRAFEVGMEAYLTKPLDVDEAIKTIRFAVERRRHSPVDLPN